MLIIFSSKYHNFWSISPMVRPLWDGWGEPMTQKYMGRVKYGGSPLSLGYEVKA